MATKGKVFTGARARLLIGGVAVGYCKNCSGGETLSYERLKVLNNIQTQEHVPVDYDVSFTAGFVRLVGDTAKTRGHFPSLGANPEEHLNNILVNGDLVITIEDSPTGSVIMTLEQAKATSNRFGIDPTSSVGFDMEFVGIRLRDESEI